MRPVIHTIAIHFTPHTPRAGPLQILLCCSIKPLIVRHKKREIRHAILLKIIPHFLISNFHLVIFRMLGKILRNCILNIDFGRSPAIIQPNYRFNREVIIFRQFSHLVFGIHLKKNTAHARGSYLERSNVRFELSSRDLYSNDAATPPTGRYLL